jgi:crotonobetainyl-CoA:carnitine CoA-transferase CaiB-like acyl-CoA transferase
MVRFDSADVIDRVIQEWVAQRTVTEVITILQKARVPCSIVNTVDKLEDDPQVVARNMIVNMDYPRLGNLPLPGLPIKLSLTPGSIRSRAPEVGEHNEEIYCGLLGFTRKELAKLKEKNVI